MRFIPKQFYFSALLLFLSIITYQCTTVAHTSKHYVDKNASGQNNGTSWANAWESFSDIEWDQIQPGDTIYISGGTDSTIYYEELSVGANGITANPITIIAGKYSPSPSGHSGRVIIDGGGTRVQSIYVHDRKYVTIKGFELRHAAKGVNVEADVHVSNIVIDSLNIYNYNDQAGIMLNGIQSTYTVDSVTIKNCRIVSWPMYIGQTDGIYMQGAQHTVIHDNYIRIPNQDPLAHNDVIQGYHCNGFIIYNNVLINDSVYSPEGGGIPLILGSEGTNPVVIYNNFIYMGGVWLPTGNMSAVLCTRWYDNNPMPPTWIINNTIIANGPRCRGIWQQYTATCINNIIAMYCPPAYRDLTFMSNFDVWDLPSAAIVDSIRSNLFWKDGLDIGFTGQYKGNGLTGGISGWFDWVNIYGGTGINADPKLVINVGYESDQGALNGELKPSSQAINKGEDIQPYLDYFYKTWGIVLPNEGINGISRDNTPTIGAYEYE